MKASRLPSGNYRVQLYLGHDVNGKKIVKSFTRPTAWEAIKAAEDYRDSNGIGAAPSEITVEAAINCYINARTEILSPASLVKYRSIRDHRLQSIMGLKLGKLLPNDVQQAVNIDAQRLSRSSVKEAVSLLSSALAAQGYDLMLSKRITFPRDAVPNTQRQLPPLEEVIGAVAGTDIELPCLIAMWLSLRISEVRGLKFCDIDSNSRTITVRRAMVYVEGKDVLNDFTKTTKSTRTNPLPEYLFNKISSLPHKSEDDFIVDMGYNKIVKRFKKCTRNKGMELRFHDLRHEFASTLYHLGIPDKYIEKLGGWSTDVIMKKIYTHTNTRQETEYQQQIDDLFNRLIAVGE